MNIAELERVASPRRIERRRRLKKRREFDRVVRRAEKTDAVGFACDPTTYQIVHSCNYECGTH